MTGFSFCYALLTLLWVQPFVSVHPYLNHHAEIEICDTAYSDGRYSLFVPLSTAHGACPWPLLSAQNIALSDFNFSSVMGPMCICCRESGAGQQIWVINVLLLKMSNIQGNKYTHTMTDWKYNQQSLTKKHGGTNNEQVIVGLKSGV